MRRLFALRIAALALIALLQAAVARAEAELPLVLIAGINGGETGARRDEVLSRALAQAGQSRAERSASSA
jgi:hypothetical protein